MIKAIIGKKLGMTQVFAVDGKRIPVEQTDGYNALQLGFGPKKQQRTNKPEMGHFKAAGKGSFACLREVQTDNIDDYNVGDEITCNSVFAAGDKIDVSGTSKGKGFQGVIKRWGFSGGRATHGSTFHRAPGAIGQSAWPAKVFKGKKMAGQMGNERSTIQNLEVVEVRPEQNIILIKGAIPGSRNSLIMIQKAVKAAK